jgi:hypothetical protein
MKTDPEIFQNNGHPLEGSHNGNVSINGFEVTTVPKLGRQVIFVLYQVRMLIKSNLGRQDIGLFSMLI